MGERPQGPSLVVLPNAMKRILLSLLLLGAALQLSAGEQPLRIFLIGDSTCATKDLKNENPERGWGHLFQPLFDEGVVVENHATNGRSTKSFRSEGRWQKVYDKLEPGDYVFIQFGHNDQKIKDTARYTALEGYAENLRRYVRETREKGAVPVLLTPVVRRHFVEGVLTDTHGGYPDAVRRVAREEETVLLDLEPLTREWVASLGDEASRGYFMWVAPGTSPLCPEGREDDTHFNVRGAHVVARLVAGELPGRIPELAEHLAVPDLVVARDGSGDFFTLSEAVAAVPDFCRRTTRITVCEGTYREKISIPASKRNVELTGRGDVRLTWDAYASMTGPTGAETGTSGSATVYFGGDNWTVRNLTFENAAGRVGQAVAVQCMATGLRFVGSRFLGNQDTLYLYGTGNRDGETVPENCRIRFEECYIEGTTDFIFGAASALFRRCEIHSKADSFITAASTCRGQSCGLIFDDCRLTASEGVTRCYLGRPWREYAQTVYIGCEMGAHIRPEGWHDWGKPRAHKTAYYAEYGSTGPGAASAKRVKWAHRLSDKEVREVLGKFEK